MIIPEKLKKGDVIGLISPSDFVKQDDLEYINKSITLMEEQGFEIKFAPNALKNTTGYGATAKEKANDINMMFKDKTVKAIFIIKGGANSNSVYDYLDFEMIKNNPKILCGFSDSTSLLNVIYSKTGIVTYHGPTFKSLTSWDTDYAYRQVIKSFVKADNSLGEENEEYLTVYEGNMVEEAIGTLVGGNTNLISKFCSGKYAMDFNDKILILEDLIFESSPQDVSNYLYHMKQNGVFENLKGIWLGNYTSDIPLKDILIDTLELNGEGKERYMFPIIQSENFGHIDKKIVIPIGGQAKINIHEKRKIQLTIPIVG